MARFGMTKYEIIDMAKQSGFVDYELDDGTTDAFDKRYEAFAKLVADKEREACAKVVDAAKAGEEDWDSNDWNQAVEFCASRIRAREQE